MDDHRGPPVGVVTVEQEGVAGLRIAGLAGGRHGAADGGAKGFDGHDVPSN
jgi:hypothetical protein